MKESGEVQPDLGSGLNDGLAFPFITLAIVLTTTSFAEAWQKWLLIDVVWKISCGGLFGYVAGRTFGWLTFKIPSLACRGPAMVWSRWA
jgi:NhaP-type Na+/H+ or K+/H+ antiporter